MGNMNVWKELVDKESEEEWEAEEAEEDEDANIYEVMAAMLEWQGVDKVEMVQQAQEDMDENSLQYVRRRLMLKGLQLAKRYL